MQGRTQIVPVQINENITVMVEAKELGGEQDVSNQLLNFEGVTDAIEALTGARYYH